MTTYNLKQEICARELPSDDPTPTHNATPSPSNSQLVDNQSTQYPTPSTKYSIVLYQHHHQQIYQLINQVNHH